MKTSDGAPVEKKIVMEDEKVTEHDLIRFCEDIWESFLKGKLIYWVFVYFVRGYREYRKVI